jgi:hypothetical protein
VTGADFSWMVAGEKEAPFVLLVDLDSGGKSVTNDAENVVAALSTELDLDDVPVYYRDSAGSWDELKHEGWKFTGFAPLPDWQRTLMAELWEAR